MLDGHHRAGRRSGDLSLSQTAGTPGAITASINNSSLSRNVTLSPMSGTKIADLVVARDNSVADGAMADTLRVRSQMRSGNTLAGQTVSVMANNSAAVSPTVTTEPDGTGGDQCHQPVGGESILSLPASTAARAGT
ncbi:hypothetical protein NWE48_23600 [Escherichia coli]|nr:hypothetical protein [Escherichia coli]